METHADPLIETSEHGDLQNEFLEPVDASNKFVDRLSLEFLLNKTHYQKYLKKTDTKRFAELKEFSENCARFSRPIMDMTMRLLKDPKTTRYSLEVQDAFDRYAHVLIRYLEIKEMSDQMQSENGHDNYKKQYDADEDTLFPPSMDDYEGRDLDEENSNPDPFLTFHAPPNSTFPRQNGGAWWKKSSS